MQPRIRIMLVDDHAIIREGYRSLLEKQPGVSVVAEAASGEEAYLLFQETLPDVVIIDLSMPGQGGLEAIRRIRARDPDARILVFSMHLDASFALQAMRAGATGYVTKSSLPEELVRAVQDVYGGRRALSADIARALALARLGDESAVLAQLSTREFQILRMLVEGAAGDAIASTLHISPKTVSNCHYQIKRKLGVSTDIELMRLALRLNVTAN